MKHINRPLPFILASTNTGAMIVNHQDYAHDQHGNTYGVGCQYLSRGSFDPSEIELVLNLLNLRRQHHGDGVTALDCGANIGAHTIAWGIEMTGWGKVISFEAQERIYYALAGNIALNNCFNVRAIHAALGNTKILPDPAAHFLDIPVPDYTKNASFGSLELRPSEHNEFIGQKKNRLPNPHPKSTLAIHRHLEPATHRPNQNGRGRNGNGSIEWRIRQHQTTQTRHAG